MTNDPGNTQAPPDWWAQVMADIQAGEPVDVVLPPQEPPPTFEDTQPCAPVVWPPK